MNSLELKIEGMTCQHCVASVKNALEKVAGVTKAEVDLEGKKVTIWGEVSREDLIQKVQEIGFTAS